jgi:hypothetical protein
MFYGRVVLCVSYGVVMLMVCSSCGFRELTGLLDVNLDVHVDCSCKLSLSLNSFLLACQ